VTLSQACICAVGFQNIPVTQLLTVLLCFCCEFWLTDEDVVCLVDVCEFWLTDEEVVYLVDVCEFWLTDEEVVCLVDVRLQSFGEWRWTSRSASLSRFRNYIFTWRKDVSYWNDFSAFKSFYISSIASWVIIVWTHQTAIEMKVIPSEFSDWIFTTCLWMSTSENHFIYLLFIYITFLVRCSYFVTAHNCSKWYTEITIKNFD